MFEVTGLSLFHGRNFQLSEDLSIIHPTYGDIEEIGEDKYYTHLSCLSSTSKDIADILWFDMNIWYEDITDEWSFFLQKCTLTQRSIDVVVEGQNGVQVGCLAIDLQFRDALNYFLHTNGEWILSERTVDNASQSILTNVVKHETRDYFIMDDSSAKFTKLFYEKTREFLNKSNWNSREYEFERGGTKGAKKYILKNTLYKQRKKRKKANVDLQSIGSSLVAKGISYKELWDIPIYAIYELYYRQFKIVEYDNTMAALHAGCLDTTKNPIDWDKINWSAVIK